MHASEQAATATVAATALDVQKPLHTAVQSKTESCHENMAWWLNQGIYTAYAQAPETSAHHLNDKGGCKRLFQNLWPHFFPQLLKVPQSLWLSPVIQANFELSNKSQSMRRLQMVFSPSCKVYSYVARV